MTRHTGSGRRAKHLIFKDDGIMTTPQALSMRIEQATSSTVAEFWARLEPRIQRSNYLEEAAQALASALHTEFRESVLLARVFVTVPFGVLPATNKRFVKMLVGSTKARAELEATTPVLSLIGTHGQEDDWNERRKSKGHAGIPLISSSFVDAIPMISRLLKDLGVPVDWVDSHDSEMIVNTIGSAAGLFFVEKAATATDHQGRKIIAAQDFVSTHSVGSVFGIKEAANPQKLDKPIETLSNMSEGKLAKIGARKLTNQSKLTIDAPVTINIEGGGDPELIASSVKDAFDQILAENERHETARNYD